jgi:hypothetical protein
MVAPNLMEPMGITQQLVSHTSLVVLPAPQLFQQAVQVNQCHQWADLHQLKKVRFHQRMVRFLQRMHLNHQLVHRSHQRMDRFLQKMVHLNRNQF